MRSRWRQRWRLWALALIPVVALATVECLYRLALPPASLLPPRPVGLVVPPLVARALWASREGSAPLRLQHGGPGALLRTAAAMALAPRPQQARLPEGWRLADSAARDWLYSQRVNDLPRPGTLQRYALGLWMTREWSAEELLAFHTERLRVGPRARGMWTAAHLYLGREWTRLNAADTALLTAIAHAPTTHRSDPWCHPEPTRERRNHVLREMHRLGFIDEPTLEASLRAPLRLSPRPASWKPC